MKRLENSSAICGITGKEIPRDEACVDHAYPRTFSALIAKWMERRGLSYDDLPVEPAQGEIHQWRLRDMELLTHRRSAHQFRDEQPTRNYIIRSSVIPQFLKGFYETTELP